MNILQAQSMEAQQRLMENGPDARRMRKAIFRRTIDYNAAVIAYLKDRIWQRTTRKRPAIQPDYLYNFLLNPPGEYLDSPMNCVTGKPVRTSTNKNKCPIYCVCWTPEGRRLITGAYSGEFTLWNGLTFNFETILQAHESQIRCMKWSHNDDWLLTADHSGYVKYWQANMNNVEMYQAHKEPIRGVSFSPFDTKFVTCSDDSTVRIWDFLRCTEERVLRGHGSDVRSVAWHPYMSLIMSGSKDAQQPIKLWEPKTGESIATLYVHKNTCTDVSWNQNGNWFLTASRDHLIKLFDLRYMKTEMQTFRGHKRDVMRVAWHPCHESLFASGSADGTILFWCAGTDTELGAIDDAHESMIWSLAWHPLGHILVSGANDFATKFWTRNRPGDILKEMPGTGNVGSLPALATDGLTSSFEHTKSQGDLVNDEIGGSLARALADAAGRLPIFESNEITLPMPTLPIPQENSVVTPSQAQVHRSFENEETEEPRRIEIPGLNEGPVCDLNSSDTEMDSSERNKLRQARSIPKEFAANWASMRVRPTSHVVLSAVSQNQSATLEAASTGSVQTTAATMPTADNATASDVVASLADDDKGRSSSTNAPLFTSDMRPNHSSSQSVPAPGTKDGPASNEDSVTDHRHGSAHKMGRKFDTAAREEDMLAFANNLNISTTVSEPRSKHSSAQPPLHRSHKSKSGPLPSQMGHPNAPPAPPSQQPPPPPPDHCMPRPRVDRYGDGARFPGHTSTSRPSGSGMAPQPLRDYPGPRQPDDPWGGPGYPPMRDHLPPGRGGPWRHDGGHPMERDFRDIPPRSPMPPPSFHGPAHDQWPASRFREDPAAVFPPPPKRPAHGRHMGGSSRQENPQCREPWNDLPPPAPPSHRSGW
ncbi:hypothetical protein AAHC03_09570 [Spirometra sp. Aus1]